jgi:SHS2 domain-containing protein
MEGKEESKEPLAPYPRRAMLTTMKAKWCPWATARRRVKEISRMRVAAELRKIPRSKENETMANPYFIFALNPYLVGSRKDYNITEFLTKINFPLKERLKKYETFDHTADLGVRVFGQTAKELFANAAYALFDLLTDVKRIRETLGFDLHVEAADREELLVRWLSELLFLSESPGYLFKRFSISHLDQTSLRAVAHGETFDPSRHAFNLEIKAVTYHQVAVKEEDGKWEARVIFDI